MPDEDAVDQRIARVIERVRMQNVRLGDCLSEEGIATFERQHGIALPEDYRAFVLNVGNGGDGPPAYGIARLGEVASDMHPEQRRNWTALPNVREPFPFTKPWVWENDERSEEGKEEHVDNGSIYIGNDGCGMYWFIIVTGPERGNVWMICGEGIQATEPKRDFLKWYQDWLDGVEDWWS